MMKKKLLGIDAPHFHAAIEVGGRVAPIIAYMRRNNWSEEQIREYCAKKGWSCITLEEENDE